MLRVICPSCKRALPVDMFDAPRRTGLVRKDRCTPCRRQAAADRKAKARAEAGGQ